MIFERTIAKVKVRTHADDLTRCNVEQSDVVEVLADMLNLPESNISVSLKDRLTGLKDDLLSRIVGQDVCINRIAANIVTAKMDFDIKKNRPDGVFLFIGPTGVGKTETGIALSKALYGSTDYLVRIDMSEYMEKFTYSRFVGAAPGYVGYMDSNQLTDKVRQNPYSIILLDEIEKADSQLLNIFLQVFDAGRLTDARGNVVDFSHTTIIMTSNIGTNLFSRAQMGYSGHLDGGNVSHAMLLKTLKKYFSPEFLNRLDEIIIFDHLERDSIKKIIDIQLEGTRETFEKIDKELILKEDVIDFIIAEGYSKEYGARHIARALRKHILEKVAQCALEKDWDDARQVVCSMNKGKVEVHVETGALEPIGGSRMIEEIADMVGRKD
jgi:ATP-dependent Clp protease ATP-binding subunit ClpC